MALMIADDQITEAMLEDIMRAGPGSIIIMRPGHVLFYLMPEPEEIYPFGDRLIFNHEPYDDGGGAAICRARFGF